MFSFISFSTFVFTIILSLGETTEWDYMVFSQSWPSTTCTEWKSASVSHYCTLPKDQSHWIVHGLWPTKNGTEGPSYCPGSEFNKDALVPIISDLEEDWTNVEMPTEHFSFWKHEWEKHGRCAGLLPELNSEFKYFKQGLNMLDKYKVAEILKGSGIVPGERLYSSEELYNSMHSALGKVPAVHCVIERGTGKVFVHEIRICLDKNFEAIDCQGHEGKKVVNCGADPREEVVHYPLTVPTIGDYNFTPPSPHWLYKLFYILRLLVWFSL